MSRIIIFIGITVICINAGLDSFAQGFDPRVTEAQRFLDNLVKEDYPLAVQPFDSVLTARMPAETLRQVWEALQKQVGRYIGNGKYRTESRPPYFAVYLTCRFERTTLDMKVVFNPEDEIAGLFFMPAKEQNWKMPSYADTSRFTEQPVEIVTDTFRLKGILTLPVGKSSFPVVVLVHGSGPEDMDETVLSNKVFKDIAWGLSSRGIGVLRYNKRTFTYGSLMDPEKVTVEDVVIEDAVSAIRAAVKRKDAGGVYLLGHSLGGYLAPQIAKQADGLKGVILLAANARPLEELIMEQVRYLLGLDGYSSQDSAEIAVLAKQVSLVKSRALSDTASPSSLPLGIPASYWLSLRYYDPVQTAVQLQIPILVLQGERDYQVTMTDFSLWKKGLTGIDNARFTSFPQLNHLFMKGQGKSIPDDYYKRGHVSADVINRIAEWIMTGQ
ncbi:MAG: alpha/beta fold hydrolase [Chlorobi bacterium]|nr:alpha/beta fold hydrolase [Chlorobiota bacterium]